MEIIGEPIAVEVKAKHISKSSAECDTYSKKFSSGQEYLDDQCNALMQLMVSFRYDLCT